ncbi:MAG: hypothetical protein ACOH16_08120 [Propionibacteriaceae bacterium]
MRTPKPWTLPTQPVTRALLLASGITDAMIRTQLRAGRLVAVRYGVFLSADAWPADAERQHLVRAHAEIVANPGSVMSHESAAVSWGLHSPGFAPWHESHVSLTLAARAHGSRRSCVTYHVADLPAMAVARDADGYLVTSVARTAVDLAGGRSLPEALVMLDAAGRLLIESYSSRCRREDYVNPRYVRAVRAALIEAVGRRWRVQLLDAIGRVEPCRESPAESLTAGHLHLSGLPMPQFQARIVTRKGTFYPDCYWREANLIGECDGKVKYSSANEIVREKERQQVLHDEGNRFVRWLGKEIMLRPYEVIDRIARALAC